MAIVIVRHPEKGDMALDTHEMRLRHLSRRIRAWVIAVLELAKVIPIEGHGVRLSYAPGDEWGPRHVTECISRVRQFLGEALLTYAWVAELQERGAVHYHLCLVCKKGTWLPMFDTAYPEYGIRVPFWGHGLTHVDYDINISGEYFMKYTQKSEQKRDEFPKGLRIFACVLRPHARELIPAKTCLHYRLSAAVAVVRSYILNHVREWSQGQEIDELYRGWEWESLSIPGKTLPDGAVIPSLPGGGDWLIRYRGKLLQIVHTEWRYVGDGELRFDKRSGGYTPKERDIPDREGGATYPTEALPRVPADWVWGQPMGIFGG
jgi:hypothetical protein